MGNLKGLDRGVFLSAALAIILVFGAIAPSTPRASANEVVTPPSLVGSAVVGETLSVSLNDWEDLEVNYRWFRDGSPILDGPGGTSGNILRTPTFTLSQSDIRGIISVHVAGPTETQILQTPRVPSPASIASSVPTISGSTLVGGTLTVDEGEWTSGTSFSYRWLRNGFAIAGATSSTYVLAPEDFGVSISVEVTGVLTGSLTESRTSAGTGSITSNALAAGRPYPFGAPRVGCQFTPEPGQWESGVTFEYQWVLIDGGGIETRVPESFVSFSVLQLTADHIGKTVALEVRGSKEGKPSRIVRGDTTPPIVASTGFCTRSEVSSTRAPTIVTSRSNPGNLFLSSTQQRMTVGQSLSVDTGQWPAGTTFEYTWFRVGGGYQAVETDIDQIISTSSYRLTEEDLGARVGVRVRALNVGSGLGDRTQKLWGFYIFPELEGDKPTISGDVGFGNTLTANPGNWTTEDLSYRWFRNNTFVATGSTYTITGEDGLSRISVEVTGRVTLGSGHPDTLPAFSIRSARSSVLPLATLNSGTVISGTREVGQSLRANSVSWTSGTSFAYQWLRDGFEIEGATSSSGFYTVNQEDRTKNISVRVTGSRTGYQDKTITSPSVRINGLILSQGTPTLSGVAAVGETLTVDPGVWTDGTDFTYEWARWGGPLIAGATSSSYTVTLADVGFPLQVLVRGSKTYYERELQVTALTASIPVPDVEGTTPTISGAAAVNQTLTAVTGSWTPGTTFAYQWLRAGEAIAGATASTYNIVAGDAGAQLAVRAIGSLDGYNSTTLTSVATNPVQLQALTSTTPSISGTAEVGLTLTASTGTWTDGTSFSYQWLRDGNTISGATAGSYQISVNDVGSALSVRVSGSKDGFASTTLNSSSTISIPALTLTSSTPTIAGEAEVGETLTGNTGSWTSGTTFAFQWLRDGDQIPGATSANYLVSIGDVGNQISLRVTGSQLGYTPKTLTSLTTTGVPELTLSSSTPLVLGEAAVGQTLTASPGSWTQGTVFSYQWERDGNSISGATSNSYLVLVDDIGSQITVSVSGRKTGYTTQDIDSSPTASVPVPTVQSVVPTISGLLAVGETLQAISGEWSEGATLDYQWRRDGTDIVGANSVFYQLTESDLNSEISIQVVGEKLSYNSATRVSSSTASIKRKLNTSGPTISGLSQIGQPLTVVHELWNVGVSFSYQWLRDGVSISGATLSTYLVSPDDAGAQISVRVTGVLEGYLTESLVSSTTNAIPRPPSETPARAPLNERPSISPTGPARDSRPPSSTSSANPNATALIGGRPVAVTADVIDNRRVQFQAGEIAIDLRLTSPGSSVTGQSSAPALVTPQGSSTELKATGFLPGSTVRGLLPFANGRVGTLPTVTANESGSIEFNIDLSKPAQARPFPIGNHNIRILGVDVDGQQITIDIPIKISQAGPIPELLSSSGEQPSTTLGDVFALVAGEMDQVERQITSSRVGVQGDGWSMELSVGDSDLASEVLSLETNSPRVVSGSGFLPGTRADLWIFSTPALIGSVEVDDNGTFIANFALDAELVSAGTHTLQIQAVGDDGYVRAVNLGVEVVEPTDGTTSFWLLVGGLAVTLLVGASIVARRLGSSSRK